MSLLGGVFLRPRDVTWSLKMVPYLSFCLGSEVWAFGFIGYIRGAHLRCPHLRAHTKGPCNYPYVITLDYSSGPETPASHAKLWKLVAKCLKTLNPPPNSRKVVF